MNNASLPLNATRITHGGNVRVFCQQYGFAEEEVLDLSTGISPWAWPVPEIPQSVWQKLPYETFNSVDDDSSDYECSDLIQSASTYYQCAPKNLLAVPGSQSAIEILPQVLQPGYEVLVPAVGYLEHGLCWHQAGHMVRHYQSIEQMCDGVKNSDAQYAVVINPNNPSTDTYSQNELLDMARTLGQREGFLIVDEAFVDMAPELSLMPYADNEPLLVMRSVGKFFGLAGLRLGFVATNEQLLGKLRDKTGLWSVNGPAQWLGARMLSDTEWIGQQRERIKHESASFLHWLQKNLPGLTWKNSTTFISGFGADAEITKLKSLFAQNAILVRSFHYSNAPSILRFGLPNRDGLRRLELALGH